MKALRQIHAVQKVGRIIEQTEKKKKKKKSAAFTLIDSLYVLIFDNVSIPKITRANRRLKTHFRNAAVIES